MRFGPPYFVMTLALAASWPTQAQTAARLAGDLAATVLAVTGSPVPPDGRLEGIDLVPLLQTKAKPIERTLFFRYTLPARRQRAVRQGDWKPVLDGSNSMLFDLASDVGERTDLA
jgi:arylsulfatase A-like enzyme